MPDNNRLYDSYYSKYDNAVSDSRWAETAEIESCLTKVDFGSDTIKTAGIPCISDGKTVWIDTDDNHSVVIGQSGSKKSRNIVFPQTLLHIKAGESMIVTDFKGEIFDLTSGYAKKMGYKIYVINLRDPNHSHRWNPFYEPWRLLHEDHNLDGARELINDFIDDVFGEISHEDRYWDDMAMRLGMGLCDVLLFCANREEATIKSLVYLRNAGLDMDANGILVEITKMLRKDSFTYSNLNSVFTTPERTRTCIVSTFDSKLRLFTAQPNITEIFSGFDFDIKNFGEEKSILYLITPDEKTTYSMLISNFVHQAYSILISHATSLPGHSLKRRVNFILDEFAQLPYIKDFPSAITAARSRNIRFTLFIQSMHQLRATYEDDAETILGNMTNTIFLNSRELPLLERIANLCGYDKSGNYLISPSRLQRLKNKEKGEALIMIGSNYPFITHLVDISEYDFNPADYPPFRLPKHRDKLPLFEMNKLTSRLKWLNDPDCRFEGEVLPRSSRTGKRRTSTYSGMGDTPPVFQRRRKLQDLLSPPDEILDKYDQMIEELMSDSIYDNIDDNDDNDDNDDKN